MSRARPASGSSPASGRSEWSYRMRDLCALSGLSRQAIHFYIQQGLVPRGRKAGKNMAFYGEAHVERLRLIRTLKHEQFLPLKAIRALLTNQAVGLDDKQRQMLQQIKARLADGLADPGGQRATIDVAALARRLGNVEIAEVRRMAEIGLLAVIEAPPGTLRINQEDAWLLELWSEFRAIGFSGELGFSVDDLAMYEQVVSALFEREAALLVDRLVDVDPAQTAQMVQSALPIVHAFFARYHAAQVKSFFSAVAPGG